jgi:hypothetical protein
MEFVFADDTRQPKPTRAGMTSLVGIGGIFVASDKVKELSRALDTLCQEHGFPGGEKFKWSPGRELWMWAHLRGDSRREFFAQALNLAKEHEVSVLVVVEDTPYDRAICEPPEMDVTMLFLERVHRQCEQRSCDAVVIVDRPGGGRDQADKFLSQCLDTMRAGTDFVRFSRIPLVLSADSSTTRLLQLADLVTGCTVAMISGESTYAPSIIEMIHPLYRRHHSQVGGYGVKLHPDGRYMNLYHWLFQDRSYMRGTTGVSLPYHKTPYADGPNSP